MRDDHTHCACNGVWLCGTCHRDVHASPFEGRRLGFIVSRYIAEPFSQPVRAHYGPVLLNCTGQFTYHEEMDQQ